MGPNRKSYVTGALSAAGLKQASFTLHPLPLAVLSSAQLSHLQSCERNKHFPLEVAMPVIGYCDRQLIKNLSFLPSGTKSMKRPLTVW